MHRPTCAAACPSSDSTQPTKYGAEVWERVWTIGIGLIRALETADRKLGKMLSSVFHKHGHFCTNHPWEVMMAVVTVAAMMTSITFFGDLHKSKVCGWNYACPQAEDIQSSDVIILTIARCLAVAYIYLQFRKLGDLGSKYLLGFAGLSSIFCSVIFSAGFVHLLGYELHGLGDSLPFFLLLLDLSKVTALARYALVTSSNEVSVRETIARGMAILGPTLTLDTFVEVLVIGIGGFSGIPMLELVCCFGCVSLIVNFIVFMTFFPGALCLVLESARDRHYGFVPKVRKHELLSETNPVTHRIKIIMSAGLVLVHVYSRWSQVQLTATQMEEALLHEQARRIVPQMPLWEFYLRGMFDTTPQILITYAFVALICLKYALFDSVKSVPKTASKSNIGNGTISTGKIPNGTVGSRIHVSSPSRSSDTFKSPVKDRLSCHRRRTFTVGEDDDETVDEIAAAEKFQRKISPVEPIAPVEIQVTKAQPMPADLVQPTPSISIDSGLFPRSDKNNAYTSMSDSEILQLVKSKQLSAHKLENELEDDIRAIHIRRMLISSSLPDPLALCEVPFKDYNYKNVNGVCCENVLGYVPIPLGVAGPLLLDGREYQVPLATTEGCLVASINRGCRAIHLSGGVRTALYHDGMTRGPVVEMPDLARAMELKEWIEDGEGFTLIKQVFDRTSNFARLQSIKCQPVGKLVYMRFCATTGDAMGMNMLCKGTEKALHAIQERWKDMIILAVSGNYCIDKKPSALNWIEGRGKSVVCEATITADVLRNVLKTSAAELVELNNAKNLIGSAMAGSIGGNNAHAANAVAAVFLATGQDIAQTVGSSSCMTHMTVSREHPDDLYISCTMPCIEVGTVGGGTVLAPQGACLKALGVQGSIKEKPGANAERLARIICGTVLAGELNLMAALAAGQLVQSHLKHNRSKLDVSRPGDSPTHRRSNSLQSPTLPCSSSSVI